MNMKKYSEQEISKYLVGPIIKGEGFEDIKDPSLQLYLLLNYPICYPEYIRALYINKKYEEFYRYFSRVCCNYGLFSDLDISNRNAIMKML